MSEENKQLIKENRQKQADEKTGPGYCTNPECGEYFERRSASGLCLNCNSNKAQKYSDNLRENGGICIGCHHKSKSLDPWKFGYDCGCSDKQRIKHNQSQEMRDATAKRDKDRWENDKEYAEAMTKIFTDQWKDPIYKARMGKQLSERWRNNPNFREKAIQGVINSWNNPISRQNRHIAIVNNILKLWQNLEYREYMLERIGSKPNFTVKNNVKFYKGIELHELIRKLDNNEMKIPSGFKKRLGSWCYNGIDPLTDDKIVLGNNLFKIRDNVRYYKNRPIEECIKDWEKHPDELPTNINKRFGRWCYGTQDILTDEKILYTGNNFTVQDGVMFVLDRRIGNYVTWESKKAELSTSSLSTIPSFTDISTFRLQSEEDWANAGGQFQQYLIDKRITYFVYIKYSESGVPLVCGQTASKLINVKGADVDFGENPEFGPSRAYLTETGQHYDRTRIGILKVNSREEALHIESEIQIKYNLWGS